VLRHYELVARVLALKVSNCHLFALRAPWLTGCLIFDLARASGSQGPIADLVPSPPSRAHGQGDRKGKMRASPQDSNSFIDSYSFEWSEIPKSTPCPQTRTEIDDPLSVPALSRPSSACSHISLISSTESFSSAISFDVSVSKVETSESPGRSAHVATPPPQAARSSASSFTVSGSVEDATPVPSTPSQEGRDEEEREDNRSQEQHASRDSRSLRDLLLMPRDFLSVRTLQNQVVHVYPMTVLHPDHSLQQT
jgi:hypothetical protein